MSEPEYAVSDLSEFRSRAAALQEPEGRLRRVLAPITRGDANMVVTYRG